MGAWRIRRSARPGKIRGQVGAPSASLRFLTIDGDRVAARPDATIENHAASERMSRIGIDASYIFDSYPTGTARYSRRLIESLAEIDSGHEFSLCYRVSRWRERDRFLRPVSASGKPFGIRLYQPPYTFWLPSQLDLFHSLAQRPAELRFKHEVVTIHDIFPITGPNYSTPHFQRKFSLLLRESMERAERILVLSEYTAQQIALHCGVDRERIRVVPGGVDLPLSVLTSEERLRRREAVVGAGNELLLVLGVVDNRKNCIAALRTLGLLPERYKVVLAGGDGYGAGSVHAFIEKEKLSDRVVRLGFVAASKLPSLFQSASALLYPSLEEGFGFPLLEAMAYGVPAVTSNVSALPEVGGNAALYADPHDPAEFAARVISAVEDAGVRSTMVARGLERACQFSWADAAAKTLAVYDELVRER
jgi:glycosyltransferase involved in cell wall biosynthesis